MRVYVVANGMAHEGGLVVSVHRSREGALDALDAFTAGWREVQLSGSVDENGTETIAYRYDHHYWASVERRRVEP